MHPNDQMDQIRELLVGEIVRRYESRIGMLEARLKEVEGDIGRRLDALSTRIDTLAEETTAGRHAAFEELSRSVGELGDRIRGLSRS